MEMQVSPSDVGPLGRSGEEDSDGNEIYHSVQEQDTSDSNESFYSVGDQDVDDEDVISMKNVEMAGDGGVERTFIAETDALEANMTEIADECDQMAEERELSDFFSNYHHGSDVKSSFNDNNGPSWSTRQDVQENEMYPHAEFRDDSTSFDIKGGGDPSRSPSVMITDFRRPAQRIEAKVDDIKIEAKVDDIEIIELDDCIEERDELIDCGVASNDIEVIGLDSPRIPEEPFVEFDGHRKVIIIESDDEADNKPNENKQPSELADWMPKRDTSPDIYEPTTNELHQSPVQRKMKKLIELAQKADKMPNS